MTNKEVEAESENILEIDDYDQKLKFTNKISSPMASKKLVKKIFKCVKKGY